MNDIPKKLEAFQAALSGMDDPQAVMQAGQDFLVAVEALPKEEQDRYRGEIAALIATLETRILSLEQALKDKQA